MGKNRASKVALDPVQMGRVLALHTRRGWDLGCLCELGDQEDGEPAARMLLAVFCYKPDGRLADGYGEWEANVIRRRLYHGDATRVIEEPCGSAELEIHGMTGAHLAAGIEWEKAQA